MTSVFTRIIPGLLLLLLGLSACQKNAEPQTHEELDAEISRLLNQRAPGQGKAFFTMPGSEAYSQIPQDPRNPLNPYKVALGQLLFHETAIGSAPKVGLGRQTYSCASCHHVAAGFQAGVAQGIGEGGIGFGSHGEGRLVDPMYPLDSVDVQPIRSPSAMNGAWQQVMLWNGQFGALGPNEGTEAGWTFGTPKYNNYLGYEGLETQAIAGQTVHRLKVDDQLCQTFDRYHDLFDQAFPDFPVHERYTRITAGLAMAAFERTLQSDLAPWQRWLQGKTLAMSEDEKKGAILFFGKAGCADCHTGPALNQMAFYGLGMGDLQNGNYGAINVTNDKPEHKGRGGFTGKAEDMFKFKVPQLYNLKDSPFYGHGATFTSVRQVIEYKNAGVPQNANVPTTQLSPLFRPLQLSSEEIDQLTLFIENSLYDPFLHRYVPTSLPSRFCFPNNDTKSKVDMGCQ